jgi:uncharacterized protein (TIGR03905 family)
MVTTYKTRGVCSRAINVEVEDGIIVNVEFIGGCSGNTQGVASLVIGMKTDDAISKIKGIKCGMKSTSCPDQLALALEEAQNA